jgi:hypothetical protein
MLEAAMGIISNVSGGDLTKQSQEWQDAARNWLEAYGRNPFGTGSTGPQEPRIGHDIVTLREQRFEGVLNSLDTLMLYCGFVRDEREKLIKLIALLLQMPPAVGLPHDWIPQPKPTPAPETT